MDASARLLFVEFVEFGLKGIGPSCGPTRSGTTLLVVGAGWSHGVWRGSGRLGGGMPGGCVRVTRGYRRIPPSDTGDGGRFALFLRTRRITRSNLCRVTGLAHRRRDGLGPCLAGMGRLRSPRDGRVVELRSRRPNTTVINGESTGRNARRPVNMAACRLDELIRQDKETRATTEKVRNLHGGRRQDNRQRVNATGARRR